ncbi:MAG: hypothetical protein RI897_1485 [Verrucomicrobiota bacterium]
MTVAAGVGDEGFFGEVGLLPVAGGEAGCADGDGSGLVGFGYGLEFLVEQDCFRVRDGVAGGQEGGQVAVVWGHEVGAEVAGFGGADSIHDGAFCPEQLAADLDVLGRDGFGSDHGDAGGGDGDIIREGGGELAEWCGDPADDAQVVPGHVVGEAIEAEFGQRPVVAGRAV